jgi:hypothetical protein
VRRVPQVPRMEGHHVNVYDDPWLIAVNAAIMAARPSADSPGGPGKVRRDGCCVNDHPYTPGSYTILANGSRQCKACRRATESRRKERHHETASLA